MMPGVAGNPPVPRPARLGCLAGRQTVTVKFTGTEDYVDETSFVVDDVALQG